MPTQLLILRFYCDILIRQHSENRGDRKFGELLLSIGYIKETSMIEVTVIHGDNMSKFTKFSNTLQYIMLVYYYRCIYHPLQRQLLSRMSK